MLNEPEFTDDPYCPYFYRKIKTTNASIMFSFGVRELKQRIENEIENGNIAVDQFSSTFIFDPDWEAECAKRLQFLEL